MAEFGQERRIAAEPIPCLVGAPLDLLFSLVLIAMASGVLFGVVFLVLKMLLRTTDALQRAGSLS
jgi:hypothetical protein